MYGNDYHPNQVCWEGILHLTPLDARVYGCLFAIPKISFDRLTQMCSDPDLYAANRPAAEARVDQSLAGLVRSGLALVERIEKDGLDRLPQTQAVLKALADERATEAFNLETKEGALERELARVRAQRAEAPKAQKEKGKPEEVKADG